MDPTIIITIVITAVVSIPAALLIDRWKRKPKLVYWWPHTFAFYFENMNVYTQSVTVRNTGGKRATNVEIIHKRRPGAFSVHPAIPFTEIDRDDGSHVVTFPTLGPKESFTIEYLDSEKPQELFNIRSADGQAEFQPMELSEPTGPGAMAAGVVIGVTGFVFLVYWLVKAVIFISQSIGVL